MNRKDALDTARRIRMDLTNAQGKLTDVIAFLESLPEEFDPKRTCTKCGLRFKGPVTLAEHIHRSHGGPYPDHWQREDELYPLTAKNG